MAYFAIRFDLRDPGTSGVARADRYAAALDMAAWADRTGFYSLTLSEHHGSPDGYLPSPLPMAAAVAARTERIPIQVAAMVAPFHDPLRLAEDAAVVDLISGGRLELVIANGYVAEEFAMFGVPDGGAGGPHHSDSSRRSSRAWTGEPFEHRGRTVRVTPAPHRPGGPKLSLGGSSDGAARRAARLGVGFLPSTPTPWPAYREECLALGRPDPGEFYGGDTTVSFLATDVDAAWDAIGPYVLHEANAYGAWAAAGGADTGYRPGGGRSRPSAPAGSTGSSTPDDMVAQLRAAGPFAYAIFHPLMGGIPPALGWESLRLLEHEVIPRLAS